MTTETQDNSVDGALALSADDKLAAARAERHKLEQAREQRALASASSAELETELSAIEAEKAIAQAEAEHGPVGKKIRVVNTPAGAVIVKRPNHLLYRKFLDSDIDTQEVEKLVRPCVVYPAIEKFERMLTDQPGILAAVSDAVTHLAGFRKKELSPK